ncbi:MAG: sensor histidine kinase [Actinomycetota bacterium]
MSPTRSEIERMLADRLDFLIGVGHDMRSPLTGIAGFAAVLSELEAVAADSTAAEAVAYIRQEAQRLVELLNQLLDFGQVEQGAPRLDREPIDLVRLVRQVIEPWAARYPEIGFRLSHQGDLIVDADFLKLHRVMVNLIDNAVHHGPPTGIVSVEMIRDGDQVVLTVIDEGVGIPAADRRRVFERFVRLDRAVPGRAGSRTSGSGRSVPARSGPGREPGAGIGLYVVKGLVEAHGGSVEVEGGEGTRLVVRLPAAPSWQQAG